MGSFRGLVCCEFKRRANFQVFMNSCCVSELGHKQWSLWLLMLACWEEPTSFPVTGQIYYNLQIDHKGVYAKNIHTFSYSEEWTFACPFRTQMSTIWKVVIHQQRSKTPVKLVIHSGNKRVSPLCLRTWKTGCLYIAQRSHDISEDTRAAGICKQWIISQSA